MQLSAIEAITEMVPPLLPGIGGTYGTMTWDGLRSQGFDQVNFSVTHDWKIKERFTTHLADVFNLFNRSQYAGVGTNLGSPASLAACHARWVGNHRHRDPVVLRWRSL